MAIIVNILIFGGLMPILIWVIRRQRIYSPLEGELAGKYLVGRYPAQSNQKEFRNGDLS